MGIFGKGKPLFDSTKAEHFTNTYTILGKPVICAQCGGREFNEASALLNTPGMTFMGLDWANRTATILCCTRCGRIDWYLHQPEEVR